MKGLDHAAHLRELSEELVQIAEERARLKAEAAILRKGRKNVATSARSKQIKAKNTELSNRIQGLIEKISQPPPRRIERWSGVIPITLHVESMGRKFEHPASTLDVSAHGMRIVTATSLVPGQTLDIYSNGALVGNCRVVWVTGGGTDRPSEVGLEILH